MLIIATFLGNVPSPTFSTSLGVIQVHWFQEIFKAILNSIDLIGIYMVLHWNWKFLRGEKDVKILSVGLGWAFGENLLSRFMPLWVGSTGLEFSWKYIQNGIFANINLVCFLHFSLIVCQPNNLTLLFFILFYFILIFLCKVTLYLYSCIDLSIHC